MFRQFCNIALTGLILAAPALAADDTTNSGAPPERFKMHQRIAEGKGSEFREKFKLTDDQLEKMNALNNKFKDSISSQVVQLGSLHRQLKDVMLAPQVDRAKAVDLESKINALKGDISIAKLNFKLDKMSILTAEQREMIRHRMLVAQAMGGGERGGGCGRHGGFHGGHGRGFRGHGGTGGPGHGGPGGPGGHRFGFDGQKPAPSAPTANGADDDDKPLTQS